MVIKLEQILAFYHAGFTTKQFLSLNFNGDLTKLLQEQNVNDRLKSKLNNLNSKQTQQKITQDLSWLSKKAKHNIISYLDQAYPEYLKNYSQMPLILYAIGDLSLLYKTKLAIVGSRNPSNSAKINAYQLSSKLAIARIVIISGMAIGIDTQAHLGALSVNGKTIAVLGSGIDVVYPSSNLKLYNNICQSGLVISQFSLGAKPDKFNFPRRNYLMSGLSDGILVAEAGFKSGSLITAKAAIEQNKEIFVLPADINNIKATGSNDLIKQGGKLTDCIDDILEEIPYLDKVDKDNIKPYFDKSIKSELNLTDLTQEEKLVFNNLTTKIISIDSLVIKTSFNIDKLNEILFNLEIKDLIKSKGNSYYRLV